MSTKTFRRLLYRRTFRSEAQLPEGIAWFSPIMGYGSDESYGPHIATHKPPKPLRLLDISTMHKRRQAAQLVKNTKLAALLLDPDEQYSGGPANKQLHALLSQALKGRFDGTYTADADADDDCAGPTEVVLFRARATMAHKSPR